MARWITWIAFVVGASVAYRWVAGRLADGAVVDAAPPLHEPQPQAGAV